MTGNAIAKEIVDAASEGMQHSVRACWKLDAVYQTVLAYEWGRRGLRAVTQQAIPEIKSVETLDPVHKKQLLTHLRLAGKRLGLLINFHVPLIKDGITRIVNGLEDDDHAKRRRDVASASP
jgi:hypothetical protein